MKGLLDMKLVLHPINHAVMQILMVAPLAVSPLLAAETSEKSEFKKPGFYSDSFHFLPRADISLYRDDNIYASKEAKVSDLITVVSPSISADSLWQGSSLKLDVGADIGRYSDNGSEDYEDLWLSAEGEVEFSDQRSLYATAGYSQDHESRDSKESSNQELEELTTYDAGNLQIGVKQQFGKTSAKAGVTYEMLDYDNVGSTLYNDDRDRSVFGAGLRIAHAVSEPLQLYTQVILNQREYKDRKDQFGYRKDSQGYSAVAGLSRKSTKGDKLDFYLGHLYQEYDESRFDEVSEFNYGMDIRWYPLKKTQVSVKLDQTLNETTEIGASSYLYRLIDLQLDQKLTRDLLGYLGYSHGLAEFQDVGREDVTQSLALGLKYYASPWIMVTGSYRYVDNDSNDQTAAVGETYDYERNIFFLSLRARLAP
jgi:hypothetical protein